MNKANLVEKVQATGLTKKQAEAAVNAAGDAIIAALAAGEKVQLVGFGTFEVRERAARKGIIPGTDKEIEIEAAKVPAFKAGKAFKDAVK